MRKSKNSGITLIALIITIIVLLILAGVSISLVVGENGILSKAISSSEKTNEAKDEEQRQMSIAEAAMNFENTEYKDKNGDKATIPAGFAVSQVEGENVIDDGLVIIDSKGNEFVWIPVEDISSMGDAALNEAVEWERKEFEEMKKSVEQYKGFYIGRYEAGSTTERSGYKEDKKGNGTTKMVVQRDQYPYNWVRWGIYDESTGDYSADAINDKINDPYKGENNGKGAVYLCRHMYDGETVGVKSTLCYKTQWNAMLEFIKKHKVDTDIDSRAWGNFYGSKFEIDRKSVKKALVMSKGTFLGVEEQWIDAYGTFGADNDFYVLTTGGLDRNRVANLFDVAGNCTEFVMDRNKNTNGDWTVSMMGGYGINKSDGGFCASFVTEVNMDSWLWSICTSFRPALYVID